MNFKTIVETRRAIRKYDQETPFDHDAVRRSLELATLAPNSSNMQLWEFHRIKSPALLTKMKDCCLGQNAAKSANELVAFVTAPQKWQQQSESNANIIRTAFASKTNVPEHVFAYYEKDMPLLYAGIGLKEYKGLAGLEANKLRQQDVRVIVNKSVSLAAMTFMYALTAEGLDTCPMEGFDENAIKALLNLPAEAEISMVISCGKRLPEGVYGERKRNEFTDTIFEH